LENSRKLDLFSLLVSLSVHLAVLFAISINSVLSGKTYEVVNVVPISFDTEVESNLIGVKPVKGELRGGAPKSQSSVTGGNRSVKERGGGGPSIRRPKSIGVGESSENRGVGFSPSKLVKNLQTGEGYRSVKLSVDLPNRRNSKLPSISSSRLVPYLIKVRDTIMRNWKVPYYSSTSQKRRAVFVITLRNDGSIEELVVKKLSPDVAFNRSAISAIYSVKSFGPFPKGVKEKSVRLKVRFEVK